MKYYVNESRASYVYRVIKLNLTFSPFDKIFHFLPSELGCQWGSAQISLFHITFYALFLLLISNCYKIEIKVSWWEGILNFFSHPGITFYFLRDYDAHVTIICAWRWIYGSVLYSNFSRSLGFLKCLPKELEPNFELWIAFLHLRLKIPWAWYHFTQAHVKA